MERFAILGLLIGAVLLGTALAITRPLLYRLGQEGTPQASRSSGVIYRGSYGSGRWRGSAPRRDWEGFQGRGPGGAK